MPQISTTINKLRIFDRNATRLHQQFRQNIQDIRNATALTNWPGANAIVQWDLIQARRELIKEEVDRHNERMNNLSMAIFGVTYETYRLLKGRNLYR